MLPRDIKPGQQIGASWLNKVKNSISTPVQQIGNVRTPQAVGEIGFWAVITSAVTQSNNQWHYGYAQAEIILDGTWAQITNGYSGLGSDKTHALNTFESINKDAGTTGALGNGLVVDELNTGVSIQPITIGNPIYIRFAPIADGAVSDGYQGYRAVFSASNAAGGECV